MSEDYILDPNAALDFFAEKIIWHGNHLIERDIIAKQPLLRSTPGEIVINKNNFDYCVIILNSVFQHRYPVRLYFKIISKYPKSRRMIHHTPQVSTPVTFQ